MAQPPRYLATTLSTHVARLACTGGQLIIRRVVHTLECEGMWRGNDDLSVAQALVQTPPRPLLITRPTSYLEQRPHEGSHH